MATAPQARLDFGTRDHVLSVHQHNGGVTTAQRAADKSWQECIAKPKKAILDTVTAMTGQNDSYMSAHGVLPFKRRNDDNVSHLTCSFVDLRHHALRLSKTQAINGIADICDQFNIPLPLYLMDTGRGMYALWVYKKPQ